MAAGILGLPTLLENKVGDSVFRKKTFTSASDFHVALLTLTVPGSSESNEPASLFPENTLPVICRLVRGLSWSSDDGFLNNLLTIP